MKYRRYYSLALLAALSLGTMLSPTIAQQTPAATSKSPAQPQSKWATQCSSVSRDKPLGCSIEQRIVLRETGQQLARISIQVNADKPSQPALLVHVPLGLSIRAGIKMQVDDAEPLKLDIQTCDAAGCYAGNPVAPELLAS